MGKKYIKAIYCHHALFNLDTEYIKLNAGMGEAQAEVKITRVNIDNDGYADDRTAVLFACDMDLKRIRNLKAGADVSHLKLIVICFDFQAELLKRYFGDLTTIRTIDSRKTAELFKIPYGGGAS